MTFINPQDLLVLRLEAMRSVLRDDWEFFVRCVCRWYSEHYHTPLHEVGTPKGCVDLEDVFRVFYEAKYKEMDDPSREQEITHLLKTPEQAREEALAADIAEADNWGFARVIERNLQAKKAKEEAKEKLEQVKMREQRDFATDRPGTPMDEAPARQGVLERPVGTGNAQGQSLGLETFNPDGKPPGVATALPEDVHVVFMTDEELERDPTAQDPFNLVRPPGEKRKRSSVPPRTKPKNPPQTSE